MRFKINLKSKYEFDKKLDIKKWLFCKDLKTDKKIVINIVGDVIFRDANDKSIYEVFAVCYYEDFIKLEAKLIPFVENKKSAFISEDNKIMIGLLNELTEEEALSYLEEWEKNATSEKGESDSGYVEMLIKEKVSGTCKD